MTLFPFLDLLIAYVVIMVVASSLVSAIIEVCDNVFQLRHFWLRRGLGKLFADLGLKPKTPEGGTTQQPVDRFFQDPEINPTKARRLKEVDGVVTVDWLMREAARDDLALSLEGVEQTKNGRRAPAWWRAFERAQTAGYQRVTLLIGFVLGFGLSVGLGLDVFSIAKQLSHDPRELAAVVARAGVAVDPSSPTTDSSNAALVDRALVRGLDACKDSDAALESTACNEQRQALMAVLASSSASSASEMAQAWRARAKALPAVTSHAHLTGALRAGLRDAEPDGPTPLAGAVAYLGSVGVKPTKEDTRWLTARFGELGLTEDASPVEIAQAQESTTLYAIEVLERPILTAASEAVDKLENEPPGFGGAIPEANPTLRFLGHLLFALFIAGGAPIWFDLLQRLLAVRELKDPSADPS